MCPCCSQGPPLHYSDRMPSLRLVNSPCTQLLTGWTLHQKIGCSPSQALRRLGGSLTPCKHCPFSAFEENANTCSLSCFFLFLPRSDVLIHALSSMTVMYLAFTKHVASEPRMLLCNIFADECPPVKMPMTGSITTQVASWNLSAKPAAATRLAIHLANL